jgi:hypothetical protein
MMNKERTNEQSSKRTDGQTNEREKRKLTPNETIQIVSVLPFMQTTLVSQGTVFVLSPSHCFPPFIGMGFSQTRDICCVPDPHVTEHSPLIS